MALLSEKSKVRSRAPRLMGLGQGGCGVEGNGAAETSSRITAGSQPPEWRCAIQQPDAAPLLLGDLGDWHVFHCAAVYGVPTTKSAGLGRAVIDSAIKVCLCFDVSGPLSLAAQFQ